MEDRRGTPQRGLSRRSFLKLSAAGAAGAIAGLNVLSAAGIVRGPEEAAPAWEVSPGVVDYSQVPEGLGGPTPHVLKVAQWYDYWPGSFLKDYKDHMMKTFGVDVTVQWDIYTSNEELFSLITLGRHSYDVIFPTNHVVDLLKKGNMIYNLNLDWIPNFANLDPDFLGVPHDSPIDRRGLNGPYVSIPYFWGTTGIAFRTDRIPKEEVEAMGLDFFTMDSYQPSTPGYPRVDLHRNMRMLEDMRDVFSFAFKAAGWQWQKSQGMQPSGDSPPEWTSNETDPRRVNAGGNWLFSCRPNLFDFNSTEDTSSLVSGAAVLNQAWAGDVMYAQRPDQNVHQSVDYVLPKQGSRWWIDTAAIHNRSRNLWAAHKFINFIHDTQQNLRLTKWNLYATPNKAAYDAIRPFTTTGYDMRADPRLYPNKVAPEEFKLCDIPRDVGADATVNLYNPLWFALTE